MSFEDPSVDEFKEALQHMGDASDDPFDDITDLSMADTCDEHGRKYYYKQALNDSHAGDDEQDTFEACVKGSANLIGSLVKGNPHDWESLHMPCIDIDHACRLIPSTTEGHFHLYIDKAVDWASYVQLLDALVEYGFVSAHYRDFSTKRGMTHVRPPWVKKPKPQKDPEQ